MERKERSLRRPTHAELLAKQLPADMGASNFLNVAQGDDPKKLFRKLSRDAEHKAGSQYSGLINMKNGIRRRKEEVIPKSEALSFAREDTLNNDKWGPAFYVEYYDDDGEEEITVKVRALNEEEARREAKRRAKQKTDLEGNLFTEVSSIEIASSGSLPSLDRSRPAATDRDREEKWIVETKKDRWSTRDTLNGLARRELPTGEHESESEAREAIKEFFRKYPAAPVHFTTKRRWVDEIEHFEVEGKEPSSKPTWRGHVRVVRRRDNPSADGFVFYGMASE